LFPDTEKGLDKRDTEFATKQPCDLQHRSECEDFFEIKMLHGEPHHGGQSEALSHGLEKLRRQKVIRCPVLRELTGHETGTSDQSEPKRHGYAGIDKAKDRRHERRNKQLR
jgi:hypothetical protein